MEFLNYYICYKCKHNWHEVWDCGCDSECPECGAKNCTTTSSTELNKGKLYGWDHAACELMQQKHG